MQRNIDIEESLYNWCVCCCPALLMDPALFDALLRLVHRIALGLVREERDRSYERLTGVRHERN